MPIENERKFVLQDDGSLERRLGAAPGVVRSFLRQAYLDASGLRIRAINYHVQRKMAATLAARLKLLAKVLALMPLSLVRAVRLAHTEHRALIALHPMIVAAGGALAVLGIEPRPYEASKITS